MVRAVENCPGTGVTVSLAIPSREPDLFKHKATDDVLLLLSRHRFRQFTLSDLATQTGHTRPAVGRAVDVLAANELVEAEADGNRRLVQINRDRLSVPDDPYLQIPQPEFHEPVKAAVDELEERLDDVLGVVLYGSIARGDADRRSDVDLWVLVSDDRPANQREANAVTVELEDRAFDDSRYAYDIDVEAVASIPRYTEDIREIIVSGIPVYQTDQFDTVEKLLMNEAENDE